MVSWASQRKILYFLTVVIFVVLVSAYPVYLVFKKDPTCVDGKQNRDEVGIDCGGNSCSFLCESQVSPLIVRWVDFFEVKDGVYDLVAQIANPNNTARIENIEYTFMLYDASGDVIFEQVGNTFVNSLDSFALFEGNIKARGRPTKVSLTFGREQWVQTPRVDVPVTVKSKRLTGVTRTPRLNATLVNIASVDAYDIDAVAVVVDNKGNRVAASATFASQINRNEIEDVYFTWPGAFSNFDPRAVCTVPSRTMLVFDRSGSMGFDGDNPPQPLTAAKEAALSFIERMGNADQVGLVSFATTASSPIDQTLTSSPAVIARAISNIAIASSSVQHTNLGDAMFAASTELSNVVDTKINKAMVILTDGVTSRPFNPIDENDESYPEVFAQEKAIQAKQDNISVYVIGLGNNLNESFLQNTIVSNPSQYYKAVTSAELSSVYTQIAEAVCEERTFISDVYVHVRSTN